MHPILHEFTYIDEVVERRQQAFSHQLTSKLRDKLRHFVDTTPPLRWQLFQKRFPFDKLLSDTFLHVRKFSLQDSAFGTLSLASSKTFPSRSKPDFTPPNKECSVQFNKTKWPLIGPLANELFDTVSRRHAESILAAERCAKLLVRTLLSNPSALTSCKWTHTTGRHSTRYEACLDSQNTIVASRTFHGDYFGKSVFLYEVLIVHRLENQQLHFILEHAHAERLFRILSHKPKLQGG